MPSLLNRAERAARLARDGGWSGLLRRELRLLRRRIFLRQPVLFLVDSLEGPPPSPGCPAGIRIAPYGGEDLGRFRALAGPRQRRMFRARLAAGRTLIVAWRGDDPVGMTWMTAATDWRLDGVRFDLPADWAYVYDLFVDPAARNLGVATALTAARVNLARQQGFRRCCRIVVPHNAPALRALVKAGMSLEPVATLELVRALGRSWVRWTSAPPGELTQPRGSARD
ncbi:MAG: GNAT family N-acetyltransferase [Gemmatimonadetes bacterium]|nr:GNAT family N-acetyltransferase [Gemmatimonadota bacterium]